MSTGPFVYVTLAGVRSATHLIHAGSFLKHLLSTTSGEVVVDYLGSGAFLGRDNVREEHLSSLLPMDSRLTVRGLGEPSPSAVSSPERRILLSVGAPGIKPYLRLVARDRVRPEVVVVDEGIGTYGDWHTRQAAYRRQGGRGPWPTVRSWAVTGAGRVLTDQRWALYEVVAGTWRVVPEVAAGFTDVVTRPSASTAGESRAVYLTQPWVELGLVTEEVFRAHLEQVASACADAGLGFAVRPHPAERGGRYAAWSELARDIPAEVDPVVLEASVVIGTDSTALLNLAAVQNRPALRVTMLELRRLEQGLGVGQRGLLDAFLPPPVDARDRGALTSALLRQMRGLTDSSL